MSKIIFHITEKSSWESAKLTGNYTATSLQLEGFIHCSQHYQVLEVANFIFKEKRDLLLLALDEAKVLNPIKYEGPSWNTFPHIYGTLNIDAVVNVFPFNTGESNKFIFPAEALGLAVDVLSKTPIGPLYKDARHYDAMNGESVSDVDFYIIEAQNKGGSVLDLACGTGRFSIPMAKAGLRVTGLDICETMINLAKGKSKTQNLDIDFQIGDIRMFELNRKFDFIFCGFNSSQHLHEEKEFRSFLECVENHLAPNGIFVLDVFNPSISMLNRDPNQKYLVGEYADPDGRGQIKVWEHPRYDSATQNSFFKFFYELNGETLFTEDFSLRNYFPLEMDIHLRNNGFHNFKKYGSYKRVPFTSTSMKQIFICATGN